MSRCGGCGATSDRARFYAGVRGWCAECWKQEMRLNRAAKREQYAAAQKVRRAKVCVEIARG